MRKSDRGFILLEIIVSLLIFSIAILSIVNSFSLGIKLNQHSFNYTEAMFLTNRIINQLELRIENAEENEQRINNKLFKWQVELVEQGDTQKLIVIVSWKEKDKEYQLQTSNVYPRGFINL